MSTPRTRSLEQLRNLMSELTALRARVEEAERNRSQSIVQFNRLLKLRKLEAARDLPPNYGA
ncbi:hypothetical protein SAMN05444170_5147 [Bradyrhizobium erythrophlei]|jgi:hypothetical protein|uniref:Uncharacterized protein n=1 Tax=Bradyrhizobium erythrophlei TaxID=1437360 RepID=A0A1M7UI14_9BRAD|nr:hypothetical protein SAMN05444170_5147 [Bradyrhizobium erythrophlei]